MRTKCQRADFGVYFPTWGDFQEILLHEGKHEVLLSLLLLSGLQADRLPASISLLFIIGENIGRWLVDKTDTEKGIPKIPGEVQETVNSYSYSQAVQGIAEPGSLKIKITGWAKNPAQSPLPGPWTGPYGQGEKLGDLLRLLTHLGVASDTCRTKGLQGSALASTWRSWSKRET